MIVQESKHGNLSNGRRAVSLGSRLERSLSAYARAAMAAGVSLLAATNSAEAKIVYTPAHTNIPVNGRESVLLDLNHDGIADFSFSNLSYGSGGSELVYLQVGCAGALGSHSCLNQGNEIWGRGVVSGRFASALRPGFRVGANKSYFQRTHKKGFSVPAIMAWASGGGIYPTSQTFSSRGQWIYTKRRYLGLRFIVNGQVHYGWARVSVETFREVTLTGYAYETVPNKPIITGKTKGPDVITLDPATLGHLAQGASAIHDRRARHTVVSGH